MLLTKEFRFESSHFLKHYHGKCERLHGHTYRLLVTVEGGVGADGMVLDFVILKKLIMEHVIDRLDHYHLNDIIPGNSSAENIAIWIWNELSKAMSASDVVPKDVRLYEIHVWETEDSSVIYRGE